MKRYTAIFGISLGVLCCTCLVRASQGSDPNRTDATSPAGVDADRPADGNTPASQAKPPAEGTDATPADAGPGIEGNWRVTVKDQGQSYPLKISREPDGALSASITGGSSDMGPVSMALVNVRYENGILRFELPGGQGAFEGTMKGDGRTIEGQARQGDQAMTLVLTRVEIVASAPASPSGKSAVRSPQVQNRAGLVAWWQLDNDVADRLGVCPGAVRGSPTYAAGKSGQAISLDGDDCVDLGRSDMLDFANDNWAVCAWIKTTQSGVDAAGKGTVFANGADEAGGIRYTLAINEAEAGRISLTTDDDFSKLQVMGRSPVNDGAWHHVVGTRDGKMLRVYVDGVLEGTSNLPAGYSLAGASQQNAYIGAIVDNRDQSLCKYFVGQIDDVCVFAAALGDSQAKALYAGADPMKVAQEATAAPLAQTSGGPRPGPAGGTGHVLMTLILILALAAFIGGIVLFLIKSNGR